MSKLLYFNLSEKMGRFISQLIKGRTKELQIFYLGEISSYKVDVLGAAFVKGLFSNQLEEDVNYINALEVAKARGVKVEQVKIREEEEYVNSIRVKVITDSQERILEGTLFANKEARFVKMDNIYIEAAPSEYMAVINNQDSTEEQKEIARQGIKVRKHCSTDEAAAKGRYRIMKELF